MQYAISCGVKLRWRKGVPPGVVALSATCAANVLTSSTSTPRPRSVVERIDAAACRIVDARPSLVAACSLPIPAEDFFDAVSDDLIPSALDGEKLHDP
jgi:hypothetical protein